jgi:hypothetical protein
MNWRSTVPIQPTGLESALQMHVSDGLIFGLVTVGSGHTYSFAISIEPQFHDPVEGRLERLRVRFGDFGPRVATLEAALASFARRRKPRVEWVQQQSMAVTQMQALTPGGRTIALRENGDRLTQARFVRLVAAP